MAEKKVKERAIEGTGGGGDGVAGFRPRTDLVGGEESVGTKLLVTSGATKDEKEE